MVLSRAFAVSKVGKALGNQKNSPVRKKGERSMAQKYRLDKTISAQGTLSRSEGKALIRKGAVQVNGEVVKAADFPVDWETDRVTVQGKSLVLKKQVYIMLNKPKGVVSSTEDGRFPTVVDLVPAELSRKGLFPAGRLDKDTTGFVLLTDDGQFAHEILSPKKHVEKTYHAKVDGTITEETERAFSGGIPIGDGEVTLPARLRILKRDPEGDAAEVVLREGMYHQIKRMFQSCGLTVVELKRVRMGGLDLDPGLKEGECRELLPEEVEQIRQKRKEEKANEK